MIDTKLELDELLERYKKHKCRVEEFGENTTVYPEKWLCIPISSPVDSLEFLSQEIEDRKSKLADMQENLEFTPSDCAFITFDCVHTAQIAVQSLHYPDAKKMTIENAPHPKDIIWDYFMIPEWQRNLRSIGIYVLIALLFIFWSIPITAIMAVSNLETLAKYEAFKWFVDLVSLSSFIKGIVKGILPSLALILFLTVMPYILYCMLSFLFQLTLFQCCSL